ncbi:MAG: sugar ABC transporter substrate-binding protein [Caldilineaceae bacterium]
MTKLLRFLSVLALIALLVGCVAPAAPAAEAPADAPAAEAAMPEGATAVVVADVVAQEAPAFDSACQAEDEGVVVPANVMPDRPLKIAVLGLENNPFWIPVKEGAMAAAAELAPYNTTVDWIVPGESHVSGQFSGGIEAAVAQEYDAIATIAGDAGIVTFVDTAVEAGIPVATFNSETAAPNKRLFFVGADLYKQGEAAGEAMAQAIGGAGQVGVITGFFAVEAHELRRQGFVDYLAANYPDVEIVGEVENEDQGETAYTQAQDFMNANPELAGIYVTAGGPFGAAGAVEDAGKTGVVKVISFDFVDETMEYVQKGVISGTIGQGPFAQGHDPAVRLFNYLVTGEVPPCARLVTEAALVTQENIADYWTAPQ